MERKLIIYTDGAARGNPGESASGYMIKNQNGTIFREHFEYNGTATNNYAEYNAVLIALQWCSSSLDKVSELELELYSDNELVVRQLNREYKIKSKTLLPLNRKIEETAKKFRLVVFKNVRREDRNISAVDKALNLLLDKRLKSVEAEKYK